MSHHTKDYLLSALLLLVALLPGHGRAQAIDDAKAHPAIPILDEAGVHVLQSGKPYSTKMTCGTAGCHDYDSITHAFHFETGRDEARDDFGLLRGQPQLVSPGYFGGYNCMGGSNPDMLAKKANTSANDFADLGSADFVMRCITCHSGGGWMEKDRNGRRYDEVDPATVAKLDGDYYSRTSNSATAESIDGIALWDWKKSGVIENDCLMCHFDYSALQKFDGKLNDEGSSDALSHFRELRNTYLTKSGLFRYTNTALLEFANLKHADGVQSDQSLVTFARSTQIPEGVHVHSSASPAYVLTKGGDDLPVLNWNADAFDANGKVTIPMLRFPASENCMQCHRTSNSRRGFYGFGEGAAAVMEEETGILVEDYQDDVHKGKTWIEANGVERSIENCSACHARNYFKPDFANVDLDASHNFLKGNSDMDVRNDLDYGPGAKSCEYCHDTAENPAIPSGQENMLKAHLELWKNSGDMKGYTADSLERITGTHLDVVGCQTCHINGKKYQGKPLTPLYRYRTAEDGKLKIVPYNPRLRYYWKDRNSGRIMTKTERNSVFEMRVDGGGNKYGAIVDPETGETLAKVSARMSHGSWSFGEPADYAGFVSLKKAYDKVMKAKGLTNVDMVMVWSESNHYLMSHNTRPAVAAVQCEECHARKQNDSFSALLAEDGLLGAGNSKRVTTLPDKRLVDEGIVIFDFPYMKVQKDGSVSENVADILYQTKLDPSMSILKAESAPVVAGGLVKTSFDAAMQDAKIIDPAHRTELQKQLQSSELFVFNSRYGRDDLRNSALFMVADYQSELVLPSYRVTMTVAEEARARLSQALPSEASIAGVYSVAMVDGAGKDVETMPSASILLKLPLPMDAATSDKMTVVRVDESGTRQALPATSLILTKAPTEDEAGYIVLTAGQAGVFAIVDEQNAMAEKADAQTDSEGSSGGGALNPLMLVLIALASVVLRRYPRIN